ncbi:saccharopine dehydrogenase family protein [Natronincola ferrireducens]|uniref:Saccharopine dehydrogenase, NADP-dependent n=1 Tax=Natronincola ferrireducens TaxID=393762 RepID=A0A1G8YK28_9FIRM|nr:saccharopine dehydrogenase C-terminal domain-containing protein [Natronincola ferrireducens]SDK03219.1 Saccharopine dehydrogenase, NADP-dependent [Natronincola ferrireducens]
MKVLLIGVGGVGEAIASISKDRDWLEKMVLADYNLKRAEEVQKKLGDENKFPIEQVDASNKEEIVTLAKKHKCDLIMNGCDPSFNESIFDAAYEAGCNYMDMAMTLSKPHPEEPYSKSYIKLGDYQFERAKQWEDKGITAIVGSGVEPGMADVFARYGADYLFDELEEIGIKDGNNFVAEGYSVPFGFSIWTTIEECLNPPVIWERDKGWYTTEPFSEPEIFELPEGIGPVELVNVEHEEVLLVPRYIDKGLKRVTFKFGLGNDFITMLKNLRELGLHRKDKVKVGDVYVSPRDVVAATAPNPAYLGPRLTGKTCAGTWIKGKKDGKERQVYLYQVADNQECMKTFGSQAVVAQTAFPPVIMMELLAEGIWSGKGVFGPEAFDAVPFMERMEEYKFPYGMTEMESEYKSMLEEVAATKE